eukprot:scaffold4097_cov166-Amphora_coffeaeformis.AAC.40
MPRTIPEVDVGTSRMPQSVVGALLCDTSWPFIVSEQNRTIASTFPPERTFHNCHDNGKIHFDT